MLFVLLFALLVLVSLALCLCVIVYWLLLLYLIFALGWVCCVGLYCYIAFPLVINNYVCYCCDYRLLVA